MTTKSYRFGKSFDKCACVGDALEVEIDGFEIVARIEHDEQSDIDDDDAHNVDQSVTGCDDDQQEKLLAARKAWSNDEWSYCGIVLSVEKAGILLDKYAASLWGLELNYPDTDNSYLTEVANDLIDEALDAGKAILEKLCG